VAEKASLTNRKKHRGLRSAPSEQGDNVFDRVKIKTKYGGQIK